MTFRSVMVMCSILLAGCAPVPTVPHGIGVVYDNDSFESLRLGESTRADVLMILGEPKYRLEDDRFFMYEWSVAYGYILTMITVLPFIPIGIPHYQCLEFRPDSCLVRREEFIGSQDKALRKCMKQHEKNE